LCRKEIEKKVKKNRNKKKIEKEKKEKREGNPILESKRLS
jgi:hypothetical protein